MTNFVESLRRLYLADKITSDKIELLLDSRKITIEEYNYILSK